MPGTVKSQGLELITQWYINNLKLGLNYTYTSTYDGAKQDIRQNSSYTNAQMVRVPRHLVNLKTNFSIPTLKNIISQYKWSDMARDCKW